MCYALYDLHVKKICFKPAWINKVSYALNQVLQELLETWSSSSAVKHSPLEQQQYISKAILICLSHLKEPEIESCRQGEVAEVKRGCV